jgi:carboxypeptidase T
VETAAYRVDNVETVEQRNEIARTGAAIDSVEHSGPNITATPEEAGRIEALGYRVQRQELTAPPGGAMRPTRPSPRCCSPPTSTLVST